MPFAPYPPTASECATSLKKTLVDLRFLKHVYGWGWRHRYWKHMRDVTTNGAATAYTACANATDTEGTVAMCSTTGAGTLLAAGAGATESASTRA